MTIYSHRDRLIDQMESFKTLW